MKQLLIQILSALVDTENKIEVKKPNIHFKEGFRRLIAACCIIGFICGVFAGEFVTALYCSVLCYLGYLVIEVLLCWIGAGFSGKKNKRSLLKKWQIKYKYWNKKCQRAYKKQEQQKPFEKDKQNNGYFWLYQIFFIKIKTKEDAILEKENILAISYHCISWILGLEIVTWLLGNGKDVFFGFIWLILYLLLLFWYQKKSSICSTVIILLLNIFMLYCTVCLVMTKEPISRIMMLETIMFVPFLYVPIQFFKISRLLNKKEKEKEKSSFDIMKELHKQDTNPSLE
jgi:hypothetical protein